MSKRTLAVLSDVHYAGAKEQARGQDYEFRGLRNPLVRTLLRFHRHFVWLRNPLNQNYLLDRFLQATSGIELAVANGDFSCNTAFIGVSDEAAFESASECLQRLRGVFTGFHGVIGDHELGKFSFVGGRGGMRHESLVTATEKLGLESMWTERAGRWVLIGVTSSLLALPVFESETLADELSQWRELRRAHLDQVAAAFSELKSEDRVLLFCHDPTALPFLLESRDIADRLPQVHRTIIGHLHSPLVLRQSRLLAGMPRLSFLGHTARRLSTSLRRARDWEQFRVLLCPSLAGIELLKDGGYYTVELDQDANDPPRFEFHALPR